MHEDFKLSLVQFGLDLMLDVLLLVTIHFQFVQLVLVLDVQLAGALHVIVAGRQLCGEPIVFFLQFDILLERCAWGIGQNYYDLM